MKNEQPDDLSQLWQSIETEPQVSADKLKQLAKRGALINKLILFWDIGLSLVLMVLIYLAISNGYSYVTVGWLGLVTLFSFWLTMQFNQYRTSSIKALSDSMTTFNQYLIDKANTDIRVGKLFNVSNVIVTVSMMSVFIYEQWYSGQPIVTNPSHWYFVIGWSVIWVSLMFAYGFWKVNKGKKVLAKLSEEFKSL